MTVRHSFGFPLSLAIQTHVGKVRTNNEDCYGHTWLDDGSLLVIVADGMGGHEAGEVASGLAVRVVEEVVGRDSDADPRERLYNGLLEANAVILDEGRASGTHGMGTTAITVLFRGAEAHVGLVGDSRLYHIRKGHMVWRTLDHTRVQMLLDKGQISDEEARLHPESGMLTRALGHARMADGRALTPDVLAEPLFLEERDALVLCSDGLHDLVEDWEIGQTIAGRKPEDAATRLVEMACERGGHDNITVAVVIAGERTDEFDPHYMTDPYDDEEDTAVEITYDEFHDPVLVQPEPVAPAGPGKMAFGLAAAGLVGVAAAGLAAIAGIAVLIYIWAG